MIISTIFKTSYFYSICAAYCLALFFLFTVVLQADPTTEPEDISNQSDYGALSPTQAKRLKLLRKKVFLRSAKYRSKLRKSFRYKDFGTHKLRICSINLEGFGPKKDMKRVFGTKIAAQYSIRMKNIITSLKSYNCHIVAIQGLLGSKRAGAITTIERIVNKLKAFDVNSLWNWNLPINRQESNTHIAFIYRKDLLATEGHISYDNAFFANFNESEDQRFPLTLSSIILKILPQKLTKNMANNKNSIRSIELINFSFSSFDPGYKIDIVDRLHMADSLRNLAIERSRITNKVGHGSFLMLAGDTGSDYSSAVRRILEGRVTLEQFKDGQICSINEVEEKKGAKKFAECKKPLPFPVTLWGTNSMNLVSDENFVKCKKTNTKAKKTRFPSAEISPIWCLRKLSKKAQKLATQNKLKNTADIYVRPNQLNYLRKYENYPSKNLLSTTNTMSYKIMLGTSETTLISVDLYW